MTEQQLVTAIFQANYRVDVLEEVKRLNESKLQEQDAEIEYAKKEVEQLGFRVRELEVQLEEERASAELQVQNLTRGTEKERKLKEHKIQSIKEAAKEDLKRMEAQVKEISAGTC